MGLALHRRLHLLLDSLPFGEQHIEGEATHHIPQGRLAVLGNGEAIVLEGGDGAVGVVVAGDYLLLGNVQDQRAYIEKTHRLQYRNHIKNARVAYPLQVAKPQKQWWAGRRICHWGFEN